MDSTTLTALAAFPAQMEAHLALFAAERIRWAPADWSGIPSEHLTAIEQACHVRDIEVDGYQRRIARILAEETPFLQSLDTDALARDRRYAESDAGDALAAFRAARARTLDLLASLQPGQWARPAIFEGYGPVTLRGLVHHLCSHDQQHLAGLQWLLGQLSAQET